MLCSDINAYTRSVPIDFAFQYFAHMKINKDNEITKDLNFKYSELHIGTNKNLQVIKYYLSRTRKKANLLNFGRPILKFRKPLSQNRKPIFILDKQKWR